MMSANLEREQQAKIKVMESVEVYELYEQNLINDVENTLENLRNLNEEYQALIGTIRVFVRVRPMLRKIGITKRAKAVKKSTLGW